MQDRGRGALEKNLWDNDQSMLQNARLLVGSKAFAQSYTLSA